MKLSVIIVTIGRPDCVRRCLEHLRRQTVRPHEVIVVDGSADDRTQHAVADFAEVIYVRNPNGFGRMTGSRNLGLLSATGDVIAYIDDDAYAHPQWAEEIVRPYDDPAVGAVGGQALNGQRGETERGRDQVGQFTRWGGITGNFAADTGEVIEVDHLIGCNMSFRREVLGKLGGFHEFYPGFCSTYEEADLCLRLKKLGWRIVYNPKATVDHEGAPRVVGNRFDLGYAFRVTRNHATLMVRNFGAASVTSWGYAAIEAGKAAWSAIRKAGGALLMFTATAAGLLIGLAGGIVQRKRQGADLIRRDETGQAITRHLSKPASREANAEATDVRIPQHQVSLSSP